MPVSLSAGEHGKVILLEGVVASEEIDLLHGLLRDNPDAAADLSGCRHLHTAALQLLLIAKVTVNVEPQSPMWQQLLQTRRGRDI